MVPIRDELVERALAVSGELDAIQKEIVATSAAATHVAGVRGR